MPEMRALEFRDGRLRLLDQRYLPAEIRWIETQDYRTVADAIRTLAVRGAPAIGLAAAYATVLAALDADPTMPDWRRRLFAAIEDLAGTRPTAVNLFWALKRMRDAVDSHPDLPPGELADHLLAEANRMMTDDEAANRSMALHGASVIPDGANVLTHCNTGFLVSSAVGTALGAIRAAHDAGKHVHVWVDETRPLLQGARLTTWELLQLEVPFTLITDSMAAHFMSKGKIDLAMVGADRIAANGDTANKIGTYGVAVLCRAHALPFYVVAPTSTVDLSLPSGRAIPIEERDPAEVTSLRGVRIAPEKTPAANPAFDVTPAELITGIVTESGIARAPFEQYLRSHVAGEATGMVSVSP